MDGCSIVIIAYNSAAFLPPCLHSIQAATAGMDAQVIVLDNGSPHPVPPSIREQFPWVDWMDSNHNLGFGKACNRAAERAIHPWLFFVNPDTLVSRDTFRKILDYAAVRPEAGVVGCKILNGDGSLQWACRRSFPSPQAAVYKTLGLAALFPQNKKFGAYNLTYLDENQEAEVDAVSGSFFCLRTRIFQDIHGFDEDFFLYGEDLDICYRVQQAGYRNYYYPGTSIVHVKGQSSRTRAVKSYIDFYQAMLVFARKHKRLQFRPLPLWIIGIGVACAAFLGLFSRLLPQWWKIVLDIAFTYAALHLVSRVAGAEPALYHLFPLVISLPLLVQGEYSRDSLKGTDLARALLPPLVLVSAVSAFLSTASWIAPVAALLALSTVLGWRRMLHWGRYFQRVFTHRHARALFYGVFPGLDGFFAADRLEPGREVLGSLIPDGEAAADAFRCHVLGRLSDLKSVVARTGASELLVVPSRFGDFWKGALPELPQGVAVKLLLESTDSDASATVDLHFLK